MTLPPSVLVAGTLKEATAELVAAFRKAADIAVEWDYGGSGKWRKQIESGKRRCDLFISADMEHPRALHGLQPPLAGPVACCARNPMAAVLRPGLKASPDTIQQLMQHPDTRIGISQFGLQPCGDNAVEILIRAGVIKAAGITQRPGKIIVVTGSQPKDERSDRLSAYTVALGNTVDLEIVFRTTAVAKVQRQKPGAQVVALPPPLAIVAAYGIALIHQPEQLPETARRAKACKNFIMSAAGQEILLQHGFLPPEEQSPVAQWIARQPGIGAYPV